MLPSSLRRPLQKLLAALGSDDATARTQRMALIAFAIRVVSAVIAFASQIVQARLMGEFEYGIFVFLWVLVIVFGNLSCLGFHSTIIRFLPQYEAAQSPDAIRGIALSVRLLAMGTATLLAGTGLLALHFFADRLPAYYMLPVFLGLFALPMIALGDVLDGTARANGWTVAGFGTTYIVRPLLILLFMVFAVTVLDAPHTATTAMQAALAATYVTALGQLAAIKWKLRQRFQAGAMTTELGVWARVALPIFLVEGFGFLLTNSDVVVVGLYLQPNEVAVYFAAAKTMALVQFVFFAVKSAAAPRFAAIMADGDPRALALFAANASRWSFWPSLGVGLAVLAAGPLLLSLFGPAFGTGYGLMAILFLGAMTKALIGPGEVLLTMAGRQNLCVVVYVGALSANIALNITLIPLYGLTGAAIATASATAIEALLLHVAVRRSLGIVLFAFARTPPDEMRKAIEP